MTSGRWVEAWDATAQKWLRLYIEEPSPTYRGSAYVITQPTPEHPLILGPDGNPLTFTTPPRQRAGFQK